jgi:hypothetical protein
VPNCGGFPSEEIFVGSIQQTGTVEISVSSWSDAIWFRRIYAATMVEVSSRSSDPGRKFLGDCGAPVSPTKYHMAEIGGGDLG